ncbi:MAG: VWA domain-containing protein [Gammaproteobacteria bacterium]
MRHKRRENEVFSISFLDVITCGFGAIILLLMIAKAGEPAVLEASSKPLDGTIRDLQAQLFETRGEAKLLNRDLNAKREQLSVWKEKVARLQQQLANIKDRYTSIENEASVNTIIKGKLELALQTLTDEMRRLLSQQKEKKTQFIGGIPVDSEYIIFIIDTSGSMFHYAWNKMIDELVSTLDVYPKVKGIQIMSDMGEYMFSEYRGRWIPDTPGRRKVMIERLRHWNPFSNSSPVEGITQAIRTYYSQDKKISLYVYGDEFTGRSIKEVIDTVERINPKDAKGSPRIRIHAVGFPTQFANPRQLQFTGIRFATLMRELTHRNGGTFVGLNDFRK